jgi:sRNA-binding protein
MTTLAGLSLVSALADLFRRAFVAERWQPHKPLKIGIDADLIASGILTPSEVDSALSSYPSRRMYPVPTAAGGFRFDLDGNPADEVTPQAAEWARAKLAHMDAHPAREARKAGEGRAWIEARRAARAAAERCKAASATSQPPPVKKTHARPSGGTGTAWAILVQRRQHGAPLRCIRYEPLWRHAANLARGENVNDGEDGARFGS